MPAWLDGLIRLAESSVGSAEPADEVVVKTTRYLRLSMVILVLGLATAVLYEHARSHSVGSAAGHCWQRSISAYYYTPVQLVFVAALVAIGVGLIVIKGSTEIEDVCLNFAGMFAPLVAFVPTPSVGTCGSVLTNKTDRNVDIANNVTALLVMAGIGLALLGALWRLGHGVTEPNDGAPTGLGRQITTVGFCTAAALYIAVWVLFLAARDWFTGNAHSIAATTMFVFIFLAVLDNAISFYFTRATAVAEQRAAATAGRAINRATAIRPGRRVNRYLLIAILMAVAVVAIEPTPWAGAYKTIWLETSMITLFAAFWVIQTQELWHSGLRTADLRYDDPPAPA